MASGSEGSNGAGIAAAATRTSAGAGVYPAEAGAGAGLGFGVAVGAGVGLGFGVAVRTGVGVGVGFGVAVGLGLAVGVGVVLGREVRSGCVSVEGLCDGSGVAEAAVAGEPGLPCPLAGVRGSEVPPPPHDASASDARRTSARQLDRRTFMIPSERRTAALRDAVSQSLTLWIWPFENGKAADDQLVDFEARDASFA